MNGVFTKRLERMMDEENWMNCLKINLIINQNGDDNFTHIDRRGNINLTQ